MKFDKERWNSMRPYEKLFSVTGAVCFLACPVFAVLELLDRFGVLSLGFDPFTWFVWLFLAWRTCDFIARWRENKEQDELDQKYTLFCFIILGALFAILVIVALFSMH